MAVTYEHFLHSTGHKTEEKKIFGSIHVYFHAISRTHFLVVYTHTITQTNTDTHTDRYTHTQKRPTLPPHAHTHDKMVTKFELTVSTERSHSKDLDWVKLR